MEKLTLNDAYGFVEEPNSPEPGNDEFQSYLGLCRQFELHYEIRMNFKKWDCILTARNWPTFFNQNFDTTLSAKPSQNFAVVSSETRLDALRGAMVMAWEDLYKSCHHWLRAYSRMVEEIKL